ncbi:hypothetical protein GCM10011491_02040 [Brucella endophytica]|uniref:Amino acid transporter protein n=1 Tax=Brucella endophytica TaxID=1963359 RepID=A0A916W965_9HYPH|nr:hypothetical protein [Brucella endophytica]GGA78467.1 hypothetical protein GCM10011491_02040 [Brucella endophytica]
MGENEGEGTKLTDAAREQIKLKATFINGLAIGVFLIGTFTPITRVAYDPAIYGKAIVPVLFSAIICIAIGFALHYWALRHLEGLDQ